MKNSVFDYSISEFVIESLYLESNYKYFQMRSELENSSPCVVFTIQYQLIGQFVLPPLNNASTSELVIPNSQGPFPITKL